MLGYLLTRAKGSVCRQECRLPPAGKEVGLPLQGEGTSGDPLARRTKARDRNH